MSKVADDKIILNDSLVFVVSTFDYQHRVILSGAQNVQQLKLIYHHEILKTGVRLDAQHVADAGNKFLDALFPESKSKRALHVLKHTKRERGEID